MSYKINIIPVTQKQIDAGIIPKYSIQVREYPNPNSIPQTAALVKKLNQHLMTTKIGEEKELSFFETCLSCGAETTADKNPCCGLFD